MFISECHSYMIHDVVFTVTAVRVGVLLWLELSQLHTHMHSNPGENIANRVVAAVPRTVTSKLKQHYYIIQ